jgi:hypothetical protein
MTIKASGCAVWILATGLSVCLAAPSHAAASADNATATTKSESTGAPVALGKYVRHGSHHPKKYAHRRSSRTAQKPASDQNADSADAAADGADRSSPIPPSVANANARLTSADTPTGAAAKAMSARASDILQAAPDNSASAPPAAQIVAADQLNDVDRALREGNPPSAPLAMASAEAPAATAAPVAASSNEPTAWDQTSLIGKIFIGFGALLTMASAARMFMA